MLVTSSNIFLTNFINGLVDGLGIRASGGGPLLALLWTNVALVALILLVWGAKWHGGRFRRREKAGNVVVGGGKAFPMQFFNAKKRTRGGTDTRGAGTEVNTPIAEAFRRKDRTSEPVEYV